MKLVFMVWCVLFVSGCSDVLLTQIELRNAARACEGNEGIYSIIDYSGSIFDDKYTRCKNGKQFKLSKFSAE